MNSLDLLIISTFPNTPQKQFVLSSLLHKLATTGVEILLISHFPIDANIQKLVRYYIYDSEDVLLKENDYLNYNIGLSIFYYKSKGFYYQTNVHRGGINCYSNWKEMQAAFSLASNLKKKTFVWMCYDVDLSLDDIPKLINFPAFLGDKKAYFEQFNGRGHIDVFSGCFFGGEIDWFRTKMPILVTKQEYLDFFKEFFIHEWMLWKLFGSFGDELIINQTDGQIISYLPKSIPNIVTIENKLTNYHINVIFNKEKTKLFLILLGMSDGFSYNILLEENGLITSKKTIHLNSNDNYYQELVIDKDLIVRVFNSEWDKCIFFLPINTESIPLLSKRGSIEFYENCTS